MSKPVDPLLTPADPEAAPTKAAVAPVPNKAAPIAATPEEDVEVIPPKEVVPVKPVSPIATVAPAVDPPLPLSQPTVAPIVANEQTGSTGSICGSEGVGVDTCTVASKAWVARNPGAVIGFAFAGVLVLILIYWALRKARRKRRKAEAARTSA